MKKKVFVDLDDTIINTSSLKQELIDSVVGMGVSEEVVIQKYNECKNGHGVPILDRFAQSFNEYQIDPEFLLARLRSMYAQMGEEKLLTDRLVWIEDQFPRDEHEYILITKGEEEIQRIKIDTFKLTAFFDRIVIVGTNKSVAIREMIGEGEQFVMVDDKESELSEAKLAFTGVKPYIVPMEGDPQLFEGEEFDPHRREK